MKKIAIVTATRAEYGLLLPVIKELRKEESVKLKVDLIVTGAHLSDKYGMTIQEINNADIRIDHTVLIPVNSNNELDISKNQAEALTKFTELFLQEEYDAAIMLGDRYETLSIAIAAGNTRTPIFHLCGGDTTEGALDEWIRHSITKISYLHFVTNEESRKRVIQLGEDPARVFNYGSTSIDNNLSLSDMSKLEALSSVGLDECRYAVCTYHPVTMENGNLEKQITDLLNAIKSFPDIQFIVTKSNADQGGARINEIFDAEGEKIKNIHIYTSLGVRRYLSLMKHCEFVIGNSSSGIIEAPSFHVPTVNIGDRQRGRLQSRSIINCKSDTESIIVAIKNALSDETRELCMKIVSIYGSGNTAKQIAIKAIETVKRGRIDLKKKFYDL